MLVTIPNLFMAVGAIIWVPLSIGMGRRPVFLLASIMTMVATLGAGLTTTFQQFFACVCFLGLGQGFALTVVCHSLSLHKVYTNVAHGPF